MSVGDSASGGTGAGRSSTTTTTSSSGSISTGASSETGTNDSSTSGSCTSGSNGSAGEGCAEQPITVDDTGGSSDMEVGNAWDEVGGPLWTLRTHAVGLFVRLKVPHMGEEGLRVVFLLSPSSTNNLMRAAGILSC
jgi:hypothetical protein